MVAVLLNLKTTSLTPLLTESSLHKSYCSLSPLLYPPYWCKSSTVPSLFYPYLWKTVNLRLCAFYLPSISAPTHIQSRIGQLFRTAFLCAFEEWHLSRIFYIYLYSLVCLKMEICLHAGSGWGCRWWCNCCGSLTYFPEAAQATAARSFYFKGRVLVTGGILYGKVIVTVSRPRCPIPSRCNHFWSTWIIRRGVNKSMVLRLSLRMKKWILENVFNFL